MAVLARELGCSRHDVAVALHELRRRGVIAMRPGSAIRIVGRPAVGAPPELEDAASEERVAGQIRDRIAQGILRRGRVLPKIAAMCGEFHVTRATVVRALAILSRQHLIHKEGKCWLVGSDAAGRDFSLPAEDPPYIVIVEGPGVEWRSVAESMRTASFCRVLSSEAEQCGVRTIFAKVDKRGHDRARFVGVVETLDFISRSRNGYLGAIVMADAYRSPSLGSYIKQLLSLNRPVVWFDRYDDSGSLGELKHQLFTRCHFSEQPALELAAKYLAGLGHRRCLVVTLSSSGWQKARSAAIESAGERAGIEIDTVRLDADTRKNLGRILRGQRPPDALLAVNDLVASHLVECLYRHSIRFPEDISVLSIDNYTRIVTAGVSSIDFGFGWLGYAAFHRILGVLPIQTRKGNVVARPFVADRGSVRRLASVK